MHPLVALVTVLALMLFFWQALRVGSARGRLGVEAPATSGNPEFERYFRVHANTLEGLMVFLPALWLFAIFVSEWVAVGLGLVWLVGRLIYTIAYSREASRRGTGFAIQALAMLALLLGAGGGVVWSLIQTVMAHKSVVG
ncbi:MAG TPA: MAPEG family protein [Caulobacteraceae bacterium]|nr:MAPEG family protein [Caulobacteraceae bacterium]